MDNSYSRTVLSSVLRSRFLRVISTPLAQDIRVSALSALRVSTGACARALKDARVRPIRDCKFEAGVVLVYSWSKDFRFN